MARTSALLVLVIALMAASTARADGDPASDYLLFAQTFVPPDIGVPKAYADQLAATVREAKARGYTIRVALIGSRYDMGSVTILYGKPKQYARFLGTELSLAYKKPLLIVMPNGLAVSRSGKALPREQAVVDRIARPGSNGIALASTATKAVLQLAAAGGVIVPPQPLPLAGRTPPKPTATADRITIAAAAVIAVLVTSAYLYFRRRFSSEE